jgi:hypothetical protein
MSGPDIPLYLNKITVRPIDKDILFPFWSIKRYSYCCGYVSSIKEMAVLKYF